MLRRIEAPREAEMTEKLMTTGGFGVGDGVGRALACVLATDGWRPPITRTPHISAAQKANANRRARQGLGGTEPGTAPWVWGGSPDSLCSRKTKKCRGGPDG